MLSWEKFVFDWGRLDLWTVGYFAYIQVDYKNGLQNIEFVCHN